MRSRILAVAGISAAALAAAAAFAGTAGASANANGATAAHVSTVSAHQTPAKGGKACYSLQTDDTGVAVTSANYSDDASLDGGGATDFSVKKKCTIGTVLATGQYYNGSGPASGFDVTIYKNKKGLPGKVVSSQTEQPFTVSGESFTITLGSTVKLKKGNYFVSVLGDMTLSAGGQWGWELSSDSSGTVNPDLWENPQDGFGTGCTSWESVLGCVGYGNTWMVTLSK